MPIKNKTVILIPSCKIKEKPYYENSRPSGACKLHDGHLKSLVEELGPESNKINLKVTLDFVKNKHDNGNVKNGYLRKKSKMFLRL